MTSTLSVLNVGAGDITVTFNAIDPAESEKALTMLRDMQQRGYFIAVLLEDGTYARATAIDASRGRYIIVVPADAPLPAEAEEVEPAPKRGRGRPRKVSVPMAGTTATAVARSAGG